MGCCFSKSGLVVAGEFSLRYPVSLLDSEVRLDAFGSPTDGADGEGERVRSMSDGPFRIPGEPKDLSSVVCTLLAIIAGLTSVAGCRVCSNDPKLGYGKDGYV